MEPGSPLETTCFGNVTVISSGLWLGDNPLKSTFPLLCLQLLVVTLCNRALHCLFKPVKLAKVSTDILTSLLLGPTALGRWAPAMTLELFPESSKVVLSTLGQLGMLYWFFLMGVQLNVGSQLKRIEKKAMVVAVAGIVSPFLVGHLSLSAANTLVPESMRTDIHALYVGMYYAVPALSVLANTVIQHKILETPFGRLALSSATCAQLLLSIVFQIVISARRTPGYPSAPLWRITFSCIYIALVFGLSRFALARIRNSTSESSISFILITVAFAAAVTEVNGVHTTTGALIFGLAMPNGLLAAAFIKKLEDVVALIVPLMFTMTGQRMDLAEMFTGPQGWTLLGVLLVTFLGKSIAVGLVASLFNYTFVDGYLTGVLLTSKGLVDTVMLGLSARAKASRLGAQSFMILLFGIIVNNLVISLLIKLLHRSAASTANTSCRTVQHVRSDTPFRILACFHGHQMVTTVVSLLKATQATPKSPIKLSALHLIHASTRCTTLFVDANNSLNSDEDDHNDPIRIAFKSQQSTRNIIVEHFTRLSSYSTMDQDITKLAAETDSAFIIVPWQQHGSDTAESSGKHFRSVALKILTSTPCSVGILVSRGLVRTCTDAFRHVAVLFFGGPDDREALAFAARMGKQEGTTVNVVRVLPSSQLLKSDRMAEQWMPIPGMYVDGDDREKVVDDYCIGHFQMEMAGKKSVSYIEKFVSCGPETVALIQSMSQDHELFIVGRCQPTINLGIISGMEEWHEFPELGLMGDLLVSPDFPVVSVLVVQQHVWRKYGSDTSVRSLGRGKQSNAMGAWDSSHGNLHRRQVAGQKDPGWQWNLHLGF
ncbi:cation/H(+) antiporter 15-like [Nymphaea colorata]|nr:cation/H(+) antiporter 15-like [Nymphaea colorata]